MKKKYIPCQLAAKNMDSAQLRESFLIDDLFARGSIDLYYTDCDRAVVGSACPASSPLKLEAGDELRADFFCQRRELGILNIGGTGTVVADGMEYKLARGESLYIGRGTKDISFASDNSDSIAEFYLLSYPAHKQYPTLKSALGDANMLHLGEQSQANVRTINQVICQARIQSAQLVMGYTKLEEGSVWGERAPLDKRLEQLLHSDEAQAGGLDKEPKPGISVIEPGAPVCVNHLEERVCGKVGQERSGRDASGSASRSTGEEREAEWLGGGEGAHLLGKGDSQCR